MRIKNSIGYLLIAGILSAMMISGCSCSAPKPAPDPLAGWKMDFGATNPVIEKDCQDYIQKLPSEERNYARMSGYFKDGTGQHAVEMEVLAGGKDSWTHILIYDKENKMIKTIKYYNGRIQS